MPTFPDEFYNPFYTSEHQEQEQDDDDYYYNNNNKKPTNVEQGDDYYDVTSFYGGTNQQKPAPKPYKPRPEYPKEVVLLKPSAALKANAYSYKHATPDYKPHAVPGTAGKDYPNYDAVPQTNFDCLSVKQNDYDYTYMHPDREAKCQVPAQQNNKNLTIHQKYLNVISSFRFSILAILMVVKIHSCAHLEQSSMEKPRHATGGSTPVAINIFNKNTKSEQLARNSTHKSLLST